MINHSVPDGILHVVSDHQRSVCFQQAGRKLEHLTAVFGSGRRMLTRVKASVFFSVAISKVSGRWPPDRAPLVAEPAFQPKFAV